MNNWKSATSEDLFSHFETIHSGLTQTEAVRRLKQYGPNALADKKPESIFLIAFRQFVSPFVLVLVIAAGIMVFLGEYVDAGVIGAIVLVNAVIGFLQEGKAQNTLLALKKFTKTKTLSFRDGQEVRIDASHVVPGDIVVLRAGDKIPADGRLIEAQNIRVNESALTGESNPVNKEVCIAENEEDTLGCAFKGTYITSGTGKILITATGEQTVIGSISKQLESLDAEVPLKKNIRQLSRIIIIGALCASVLLFIFGSLAGYPFREMFFLAVAVSVSVIPEGLPIVITLILALGVHRMGQRNALVKRMQAVEALGQADVLAVDKTGTITRNELMVTDIFVDGVLYTVDGSGYEKVGSVSVDGLIVNPLDHAGFMLAVRTGVLASDASVYKKEETGAWEVIGDPTEASHIVLGEKIGIHKDALQSEAQLLHEIPFQSELQYHATLYKEKGKKVLYVAGAPEKIIEASSKIWKDGKEIKLDLSDKKALLEQMHTLSKRGGRVIALAVKKTTHTSIEQEHISGMTIVGFSGMQDSLREGVTESVEKIRQSGVAVVMITGDYKGTAINIAEQAGIFATGDDVLTGTDLKTLSEEEILKRLENVRVFARVSPEQKLNIVSMYQKLGKKIAMTGDGVNDALSLVSADLGIGMGISGTEVAKEASDIVLLDDDIKSIVAAIEEGRSIYATLRRVIVYLFSTNLAELFVIVFALTLFLPLPLQPSQILWLNLITDGFLVLALVFDHQRGGNMLRKEHKGTFIINRPMFLRMAVMSVVMTVGTLLMFYFFYEQDLLRGGTIAMTTLAFFQWFNIWNVRSREMTVFRKDTLHNFYLLVAAVLVIVLQLFAVYAPVMNTFLKTVPLSATELLLAVAVASSVLFVEEIRKLISRKVYA